MDRIMKIDASPKDRKMITNMRLHDQCPVRLVLECLVDDTVRGNNVDRREIGVQRTLGDRVHAKYYKTFSALK